MSWCDTCRGNGLVTVFAGGADLEKAVRHYCVADEEGNIEIDQPPELIEKVAREAKIVRACHCRNGNSYERKPEAKEGSGYARWNPKREILSMPAPMWNVGEERCNQKGDYEKARSIRATKAKRLQQVLNCIQALARQYEIPTAVVYAGDEY